MRQQMDAMKAFDIEAMWAVLSFDAGISPAEVDLLRSPFSDDWGKRKSILQDAEKSDKTDWGAVKKQLEDLQKDLEQKINAQLSDQERQAFSDHMDAYRKMQPQFASR